MTSPPRAFDDAFEHWRRTADAYAIAHGEYLDRKRLHPERDHALVFAGVGALAQQLEQAHATLLLALQHTAVKRPGA